jgi:predicted DCC family thiol-disulfide oxidoreductase YuxK
MGAPVGRAAGAVAGGQPSSSPPAVLIYDGDCAMCRASALWLMRLALAGGQLEILPCRSAPRRARYPHITDEACMMAMQLVLPDGRTLAGADAVPELLRRIRGLGWLATVFALPGARPLSRRVYAWIARNRMRLSCSR